MQSLIELIPTLGFPIVCCVAVGICFYQMLNKVLNDSKEREVSLMNLTKEISSKVSELGQIVDKNTQALSILNEKLEKLSDKVENVNK